MALKLKKEYVLKYVNLIDNEDTIEKPMLCESYIKISHIEGNKNGINLIVNIYSDNTKNFLLETKKIEFTPDLDENSENFIKQGYLYLKSLEEYSKAKDC